MDVSCLLEYLDMGGAHSKCEDFAKSDVIGHMICTFEFWSRPLENKCQWIWGIKKIIIHKIFWGEAEPVWGKLPPPPPPPHTHTHWIKAWTFMLVGRA